MRACLPSPILWCIICNALIAFSVQAAVPYQLTDLGGLPDEPIGSKAFAVNDRGEVTGGVAVGFGGLAHAFLWTDATGMRDLGNLAPTPFSLSEGRGINNRTEVVGHSFTDPGVRAFLWTPTGGPGGNPAMLDLGDLPGGENFSAARDINDSGQVVGSSDATEGRRAVLWTTNGAPGGGPLIQDFGVLHPGEHSSAEGINSQGHVVGSSGAGPVSYAFLWKPREGMRALPDLPGGRDFYTADAINDHGEIVGTSFGAGPGSRAVLWTSGGVPQDLGGLGAGPGARASALGINNRVEIVGAYSDRAFIWTSSEGMLDLTSLLDESGTGWALLEATDINDAGQIVGRGIAPDGNGRAFLLTPIPEPTSIVLGGCGFAIAVLIIRRGSITRRAATIQSPLS